MIYLETNSFDPSYNLAFEEYAFRFIAEQEKDDIFMLWRNRPCIVVGKNQNMIEEINLEYCRAHHLPVVRRISGGGTVYHDLQNLNFTFILNAEKSADFQVKILGEPILQSLKKLGIPAELTPRNDLFVKGKKVCGTAQHMLSNRLLYHGCLLFSARLDVLKEALNVKAMNLASRSTKSVRSTVANLKPLIEQEDFSMSDFISALQEGVKEYFGLDDFKYYRLSDEDEKKIYALEQERNLSFDWIYGKNPSFTLQKNIELFGKNVLLTISVDQHRIQNIQFYAENLDLGETQALQVFFETFCAIPYQEKALSEQLELWYKERTNLFGLTQDLWLKHLLP